MNKVTEIVRKLRNEPTDAEQYFWEFIRNKKLGVKFLRQKPIIFPFGKGKKIFVADFFCKELSLILELDGKIHDKQIDHDRERDFILNSLGFTVLHFTNEEIFSQTARVIQDLSRIISQIKS